MACPNCGSSKSVAKEVAWDAACAIPPKTVDELHRLNRIADCARDLAISGVHPGDEKVVVTTVMVHLLNRLRVSLGADEI